MGGNRQLKDVFSRESVNIWSLKKDTRIKSLLLLLVEHLGESSWFVELSIRTSRESVYLAHKEDKDLRAYLHVYGQSKGQAGVHLEYPRIPGNGLSVEAYDDLTLPRLIDMLAIHFGISQFRAVGS